jgi:hypothetical protein
MPKYAAFTLLIALSVINSWSQSFGVIRPFAGIISGIPVVASLKIADTTLSGFYYYTQVGEPIYLRGTIKELKIAMSEVVDDSVTGSFRGTITPDFSELKGEWKGNGKIFPFAMKYDLPAGSAELGVVNHNFNYVWRRNSSGTEIGATLEGSFCYIKSLQDAEARRKMNQILLETPISADLSNEQLRSRVVSLLEESFNSLRQQYDTTVVSFASANDSVLLEESPSMFQWDQQYNWEVLFNESYLLTIRALYYEYTGGAHGNYGYANLVLDMKQGSQLALDDLFIPGYESKLKQLALAELKRQYKASTVGDLTDQGFFLENGFELTDNFFIQKNGIGFTYNPYEIAAYALGAVDVFIPWSSLQDIIRPDGPLAWTLTKK